MGVSQIKLLKHFFALYNSITAHKKSFFFKYKIIFKDNDNSGISRYIPHTHIHNLI